MDKSADNIIMNSCQYTPVYFIENSNVNQARSYVITSNNQSIEKPVSESLKRFYENSGKLETNLNVESNVKKFLKKPECNVVGNNLKLASFLLPKNEIKTEQSKPIITPVNNVVLKPVYIANTASSICNSNSVPKLDVNSKIVKLKDLPKVIQSKSGKILPKIKPKEITSSKSKHTSVQLLKLGETYHSLNQLSDDQMKIVNHALKIFRDPQAASPEPTYDPVTNTKFIYKVVSPKDLAVVGKNKQKHQKVEIQTETVKPIKAEDIHHIESHEEQKVLETKVTRSGRIVRIPRTLIHESPSKPKQRNGTADCVQCPTNIISPHRLRYSTNQTQAKTHTHTDLFQCLLNIIKNGSADTLMEQLEKFISKLKSCVRCLVADSEGDGNSQSVVSEDVGRLLGISPGKYKINLDALSCKKDKNGHCSHNPPPPIKIEVNKPKTIEKNKTKTNICDLNEYILLNNNKEKTPSIIKKIESKKQKLEQNPNDNLMKKMKMSPETDRNSVVDDLLALLSETDKTEPNVDTNVDNNNKNNIYEKEMEQNGTGTAEIKSAKPTHIQFRSTHFDIRSSPIKSSSTVFRKFQINPAKMAKYEVEIIRPINKLAQDLEMSDSAQNAQQNDANKKEKPNFDLENVETVKNNVPLQEENCENQIWPEQYEQSIMNQPDDFLKSGSVIEPSLLHVKDTNSLESNDLNQGQSILNFLESLGSELCTDTPRSNPVDFQLDLFSFNT